MTKSIAWNTGTGNITLTYQGQGDGTITVQSDANNLGSARSQVIIVETVDGAITKNLIINQAACPFPVGDVKNFSYTGSYQEVELPAGQYKLQCWGAQGGSNAAAPSYGITAQAGGKGGYSEGIITLTQKTIVRVTVGGAGSSSAGGFNGGGSTTGSASYNASNEQGVSRMGGGGGATDIRLSDGALLSRMIVAGGGAGGAMCYKAVTTEVETSTVVLNTTSNTVGYSNRSTVLNSSHSFSATGGGSLWNIASYLTGGTSYTIKITSSNTIKYDLVLETTKYKYTTLVSNITKSGTEYRFELPSSFYAVYVQNMTNTSTTATVTVTSGFYQHSHTLNLTAGHRYTFSYTLLSGTLYQKASYDGPGFQINQSPWTDIDQNTYLTSDVNAVVFGRVYLSGGSFRFTVTEYTKTSSTTTSNSSQVGFVGGGTTGGGYSDAYKGKQGAAGTNGSFGQGANQSITNYRYCGGAGGGGWYGGGGDSYSDSDTTKVNQSGGGSGFVNTAANAQYRPSGYTGLELDSGETKAGNTSFPNTAGTGNETGHSGNGYAKITRLI